MKLELELVTAAVRSVVAMGLALVNTLIIGIVPSARSSRAQRAAARRVAARLTVGVTNAMKLVVLSMVMLVLSGIFRALFRRAA